MDLSTLQPGPRKKSKRVGRGPGSGHGKTAGRGHKGQKSRSGYSRKVGFEGGQMPLNRRLPKRGFHHDDRFPFAIVNLDGLAKQFEDGAEVTPATLKAAGMIRDTKGGVKVLGRGELAVRLVVKAHAISDGARQKIEAAGGSVEILPAVSNSRKAEER
jgi:large subunit ribosomal protein L15